MAYVQDGTDGFGPPPTRADLDRVTREIEKIWVEVYAIGRRTGFVSPPPEPEEDPALRCH